MTRDIRPLAPDDLPELSRFLTAGFHTPADADFAAPDVLRWKYLDALPPIASGEPQSGPASATAVAVAGSGGGGPLSYVARDESGLIIGHVGLCRNAFCGRGIDAAGGLVPTLHMMDWLGSPGRRFVGVALMRRAHEGTPTQFGIGGSEAGRAASKRAGYERIGALPVYQRVVRPGYWLRAAGLSAAQRWPRVLRDQASETLHRLAAVARPRRQQVVLQACSEFGDEVEPIVAAASRLAILTDRPSQRLNHMLRFPRQSMTGWRILAREPNDRPGENLAEPSDGLELQGRPGDGKLLGFALLNVVPQDGGRTRLGKIVDCLLIGSDPDRWRAAIDALTGELGKQGADVVQAYAGTPWLAEALRRAGFVTRFALDIHLCDPQQLIPRQGPFHFSPLEADYAYT
jgi:hypothetical protein